MIEILSILHKNNVIKLHILFKCNVLLLTASIDNQSIYTFMYLDKLSLCVNESLNGGIVVCVFQLFFSPLPVKVGGFR